MVQEIYHLHRVRRLLEPDRHPLGVLVFDVICGLLTAAVAARQGAGGELAEEDEETETGAV